MNPVLIPHMIGAIVFFSSSLVHMIAQTRLLWQIQKPALLIRDMIKLVLTVVATACAVLSILDSPGAVHKVLRQPFHLLRLIHALLFIYFVNAHMCYHLLPCPRRHIMKFCIAELHSKFYRGQSAIPNTIDSAIHH